MLSREDNDLLTQTGPGTPGGDLMRRYWQPVALSRELPLEGAPLHVRIFSEDLVLFRDNEGRLGLLGLHCPHRATDLSYGRVEDGGIRCIYHGRLFDIEGRCLETPGEPAGSDYCQKTKHLAYPCQEAGGFILTYMGPGAPPLLPKYEFLSAPEAHTDAFKYFQECNYLQGNEGNIDPVHVSFVHRLDSRLDSESGRRVSVQGSEEGIQELVGKDVAPILDVEETDFGVRIYAIRNVSLEQRYVRITYFIMPNLSAFPGATGADGYSIHWHVPIDDECHWKYQINYQRSAPIKYRETLRIGSTSGLADGYRMQRNKANRYLQDREEMKGTTFAGLGSAFGLHDSVAIETMGAIQDRTKENLGASDKAIIQARRMLLKAIGHVRAGLDPLHVVRDSSANDFSHLVIRSETIPSSEDWRSFWRKSATV